MAGRHQGTLREATTGDMRWTIMAVALNMSAGIKLALLPTPRDCAVSPGETCKITLNSARTRALLSENECIGQLLEPVASPVVPVLKVTSLRLHGADPPFAEVTCVGRSRMLRRWTTNDATSCADVEPLYDSVDSEDEAWAASLAVRMRYQACRELVARLDNGDERAYAARDSTRVHDVVMTLLSSPWTSSCGRDVPTPVWRCRTRARAS